LIEKRAWLGHEEQELTRLVKEGKRYKEIADILGRSMPSIKGKARELGHAKGYSKQFEVKGLTKSNRTVAELLEARTEAFRRKKAHHEGKKDVHVKIGGEGPYMLMAFGDPHVDDDGVCLATLKEHMDIARQPEVFAFNIGDLTNNWVGKLRGLYAHQQFTEDEATEMMRWLISEIDWLWVILGNHDKWSHVAELICRDHGVHSVSHGGIFHVARGDHRISIDARHDHQGRSMYNAAHGQVKRNYRGSPCDVIIGGHTHTIAYMLLKNGVSGQTAHCLRVGSYKLYDDYADRLGYDSEAISPCVAFVVDPRFEGAESITVFHDPKRGLEYLQFVRNQYESESNSRRSG